MLEKILSYRKYVSTRLERRRKGSRTRVGTEDNVFAGVAAGAAGQ